MFNLGWTEILLIVLVIMLLFGRGKVSGLMGDFGKGIKNFRKGLSDADEDIAEEARRREEKRLSQDASLSDAAPRKDDAAKN